MKKFSVFILAVVTLIACKSKHPEADAALLTDPSVVHRNEKTLTEVIIYDVFSPPVASRIYAYTSLAAYEAIRFMKPGYVSLTAQMHGFPAMPQPESGKNYNFLLASSKAFFTVAEKVTFSIDTLKKYENKLFGQYESLLDKETFKNSMDFGESVGKAVLERTKVDNYQKTRGMPKYLGANEPGKWQPTPPDYLDGIEPYWAMIMPLTMDSLSHFRPLPPPLYSTDTNSLFYKTAYEVYATVKNLTPEQRETARYWDDNPFVTEHSGHLMFGNKKITPVGHWIGITGIAAGKAGIDAVETAQAYAITATGIFDGFISCWEEKFRNQLVRPVTYINLNIDSKWEPVLQTPPFPEHTSGHSTISSAAATLLTKRFGDSFAFTDTSDLEYIGMKRDFKSFNEAATEVSISRLYGGIHFRTGIEEGAKQGVKIAEYINTHIKLKDSAASAK